MVLKIYSKWSSDHPPPSDGEIVFEMLLMDQHSDGCHVWWGETATWCHHITSYWPTIGDNKTMSPRNQFRELRNYIVTSLIKRPGRSNKNNQNRKQSSIAPLLS